MKTEDVKRLRKSRQRDDALQNAPPFKPIGRHIEIFPTGERELAEDGVPVVSIGVHRILSIDGMRPHLAGEEFNLGTFRPPRNSFPMFFVVSQHFLKKDDVGLDTPQGVPHLTQHKGRIVGRKTLMDVIGNNLQAMPGRLFHFSR